MEYDLGITYFTFEVPGNRRLPLKLGGHIVARCLNTEGRTIIRPYTPVSRIEERGWFRVAVKIYDHGEMSKCMKTWRHGSMIDWRGPFRKHSIQLEKYKQLVMVAGGTGITPMLQYVNRILSCDIEETQVVLLYSIRTPDEIIEKKLLDDWNGFWNFDLTYFLTGDEATTQTSKRKMRYGDNCIRGRISQEWFRSNKSRLEIASVTGDQRLVLVCGSNEFNRTMREMVSRELDASDTNILIFD